MSQPGPWGRQTPPPRKSSRLGLFLWLGAIGLILIMVMVLNQFFPDSRSGMDDVYIVRNILILAVASSGLLFVRDINLKRSTRNLLLWFGIAAILVAGFVYQDELHDAGLRLRSALVPGYPVATSGHQMVVSESDNGSYMVIGAINGEPVRFLIDTGASDVVLSPADARRLGIDPDTLAFDHSYETANGIGHGAAVTLDKLSVGSLQMSGVAASVDRTAMSSSLLGMTFLKRLKSFSFSGHKLVLTW